MEKYDAVIAGYLCVDFMPDFKKGTLIKSIFNILKPGRLIELEGFDTVLGGVVANTGIAMKKFDKNIFLNASVGDDFIGRLCIDQLKDYNIPGDIQTIEGVGTALSLVIAPPGVDRIFLESPGCSRIFDINHINFEAVQNSYLFHFGYPPLLKRFYLDNGKQLTEMLCRVKQMGVVTSVDFSLPDEENGSGRVDWKEILKEVLPLTDIFVPSLEEALYIMMPAKYAALQSGMGTNEDIIDLIPDTVIREMGRRIIECGSKIALIKAGHRGIYLFTGNVSAINKNEGFQLSQEDWNNRELWCRPYPISETEVKNASGAGDTAIAAFLSALLEGRDSVSSVKCAAFAGRNNLYSYNSHNESFGWKDVLEGIEMESNKVIDLKKPTITIGQNE